MPDSGALMSLKNMLGEESMPLQALGLRTKIKDCRLFPDQARHQTHGKNG